MKILHGTWIPEITGDFIEQGAFYLWVETSTRKTKRNPDTLHPQHLTASSLQAFVQNEIGISEDYSRLISNRISLKYFALPTLNQQPLPSPELAKYLETDLNLEFEEFATWEITTYQLASSRNTFNSLNTIIKLLKEIHFLAQQNPSEMSLGSDLFFWYHYTQLFKQILYKDQYIPALKYRQLASTKTEGKRATQTPLFEIYSGWEIISEQYQSLITQSVNAMPLACVSGSLVSQNPIKFYNPETLLRHFSECLLHEIVTQTPLTAKFNQQIADTLVHHSIHQNPQNPRTSSADLEEYKQWLVWKEKLIHSQTAAVFDLCFQLQEATQEQDNWLIHFSVSSKQDPSFKLLLKDYWQQTQKKKKELHNYVGKDFEKYLLLNLGYAARMYPKLWQGLETDQPVGLELNLIEAFEFLKESAWILEDSGYKVIIPAWWTPQGRHRAKIRLKTSSRSSGQASVSKGFFNLDTLIQYQYSLSIGGEVVTPKEWEQLVNAKTHLIQFRGQWMELDQQKMQQMLEFWQKHTEEKPEIKLLDFVKMSASLEDELEVEHDSILSDLMGKLQDKSQLTMVGDIPQLQGTLRDYQKRGVSWLQYLENLGLNGCLADDMGLGKSVQVIARLVQEKETVDSTLTTLLIAPTSVIGNWQKEIEKFAPHLQTIIHHGSGRIQDLEAFKSTCLNCDVVITSFTLVRQDEKLFNHLEWRRIVVDEAQNIKNPKTAQTRAILKLSAQYRLALTGTPVENRLLDLWSIFNFLNPGYLGKEAQFRKSFEIPIQKDNDRMKSATLKKLVEPLILRRVKTDPSIINDLPDKVEQKVYCNLTKEQASLYEALVKDVAEKINEVEGMKRKGLILSTLMKLKQICNHPAQFLQDGSEFSAARSQKLQRLADMAEEAISEGESLLVFSQFKEVCDGLERHFKHHYHYNTYYIHGGTNRTKREQMITEFQNPETEPSVFILSLKAGGVGITLTKANHVFHFDRWWNPAVEDQATDRAFRIGQTKNVFVHKFVALGTLEEKIDQMIEDKKKLSSQVIGSDESWLTELDNEAFKQLIQLNKLALLE